MVRPRRSAIPEPRPYVTLDIESCDWKAIDLIGTYDGSTYRKFVSIPYLLAWLERRRGYDIYAHYGGGFDFWFLISDMFTRWRGVELARAGGSRVTSILVPSHDLRFIDSYSLMPAPLSEICEEWGLDGYVKLKNFKDATPLELELRNRTDCELLYRAIDKWREFAGAIKCSPNSTTIGAAAVDSYLRALGRPMPTQFGHRATVENGYYGGRVEVFRESHTDCWWYDLRSAYGWAMQQPLPYGPGTALRGQSLSAQLLRRADMIGFVGMRIELPAGPGLLPVRIPDTDTTAGYRVEYPSKGIAEGVWCTREIAHALDHGARVVEVMGGVMYQARPTLARWTKAVLSKRDEWGFLAKRAVNSLYGKFGQSLDSSRVFMRPEKAYRTKHEMVPYLQPELDVWTWRLRNKAPTKLLPIAAAITALARVRLAAVLVSLDHAGAELVYCDTDGVVYVGPPLEELGFDVGSEPGQWECEGRVLVWKCLGSRWYRADTMSLLPGGEATVRFASAGVERINAADFSRLVKGLAVDKKRMVPFNSQLASIRLEKDGASYPRYDAISVQIDSVRKMLDLPKGKIRQTYWKSQPEW